MARGIQAFELLVAFALCGAGCAGLLGVQSIESATDAGALLDDGAPSMNPPPPVQCRQDAECSAKLPPTNPAGCAIGKCVGGQCAFLAKDADGDGFRMACTSSAFAIDQGAKIDCDDSASGVVPDTELDCSDGSFELPVRGECRPGKKRCNDNGMFGECIGAIGKKSTEACDNKDDDCDGTIDNGCTCSPGSSRPCGPAQAGTGLCKQGTQLCVNAMWDACVGAVFPAARNCLGPADTDCNTKADNTEATCLCDGTVTGGSVGNCSTGLQGACAAGTRVCTVNAAAASWGACTQTTASGPRNCASTLDNDCNGIADKSEAPCMCGGIAVGQRVACMIVPGEPGFRYCESQGTTAAFGICE